MSSENCFASIMAVVSLSIALMSSIAHAAPMPTSSDKNYEIVLVEEDDVGTWGNWTASSLETIFMSYPGSPFNVTRMSAQGFHDVYIGPSARGVITDFDLLVWQTDANYESQTDLARAQDIAAAIRKSAIPTVLMDGPGFPLSRVTELIPPQQPGNGASYVNASLFPLGRGEDGIGTEWHPLVPFSIDHPEGLNEDDTLWIGVGGRTHTVDLNYYDPFVTAGGQYRFTRPVWSTDLSVIEGYSLDDVALLVDDRRHILATGFRADISVSYPDEFISEDPLSCGAPPSHYTSINLVHSIFTYLLQPTSTDPPVGQNTFTETDWTVSSVGFDFEVKRTYTSGNSNTDGYLGRNWTSNHDRYLIWDKFNENMVLHDGNGTPILIEMVEGPILQAPGLPYPWMLPKRPVFTTVNSSVKLTAVYYHHTDTEDENLSNYPLYSFPGSGNPCTNADHSNRPPGYQHREGFLIRDAAGNKAFYARQFIRNTIGYNGDDTVVLYPDASIRGGELQKYRITYYEDAAGNRQEYHYKERVAPGEPSVSSPPNTPERLLWCIIDTEGRGYEFDTQWFHRAGIGPPEPKLMGINTPFRSGEQRMPDIQYWWGVGDYTNRADYINSGLQQVKWVNRVGDIEINKRSYGYLYGPMDSGGTERNWNVPLIEVMNRYDTVEKEFEYSEDIVDNFYCRNFYILLDLVSLPMLYPGRLIKTINGSDLGEQKNETTYFHHLKTGIPDVNNLSSIWGWTTSVKNGVASTKYLNGKSHVVKIFDWYMSGREIAENPLDAWGEGMPQTCSINLDDLQLGIDPSAYCEGWTQEFTTNYDGNVVTSTLPSGITETQTRLVDTVFTEEIDATDDRTADEQMLDFWKNYWHLTYWLSNKIEEATIGTDSQEYNKIRTFYEPVYNMPFRAKYVGGSVIKEMHYVYMENGGFPSGNLQLLKTLFPNVPDPSFAIIYPSYLPRNFFKDIDDSSYTIPFVECDRGGAWENANAPALPYCELLPPTTGYVSRTESVTGHSYDDKGREIWFNDPESVPTRTVYSTVGNSSVEIHTRASAGIQLGEFKLYDWQHRLIQEGKGEYEGSTFNPTVTRHFTYDLVGNTKTTTVRDGSGKVFKRENYLYDEMGNRIVTRFGRCPWDWGGDCEFEYPEMENEVGEWGYHLNAYDSLGREVAACVQVTPDKYDCVKTVFQGDGLKYSETRYSGCVIESELWEVDDVEFELKNLPSSCSEETETRYEYDGRNSLYETLEGDATPDVRSTKRYYTKDGKIGAFVDAADSDHLDGAEATHYYYDERGLLRRETTGLNPDLVTGPQPVSTTYHRTPLGDVAMKTQGISSGTSDDQSLGKEGYFIDQRRVRTAKLTYQYTVGESPGSAHVHTWYDMDQHNQVVTQETSAGSLFYTTVNHRDRFGRLIGVENGDTNTAVSYSLDALGRIVEQMHHNEADISSAAETMTLFEYDVLDNVVSSVQVKPDDSGNPDYFQETTNIYDGFGYLVASIDPMGKENIVTRDGRGNALATYEVLTDGGDYSYWNNSGADTDYALLDVYPTIGISAQYDWRGNVTSRIDSQGNETQFDYNQFGETKRVIRPDGSSKVFTRNDDGAITQIVYSDGDTTTRTVINKLDSHNRVAQVDVDQGVLSTTQTFTYWDNGLVKWAVDYPVSSYARDLSSGLVETHVNRKWDTLGNLKQDSQNVIDTEPNERISNANYRNMSLMSLERPTYTPTSTTSYVWDETQYHPSLLVGASAGGAPLADLAWTGNKLASRTVHAEGAEVSAYNMEYDIYGNQSRLQIDINSTQISDMEYEYDKANRLGSELDGYGKEVIYELDNLGRVKSYDNNQYGAIGVKLDDVDNVRQTWDFDDTSNPSAPYYTDDHSILDEGTGSSLNQLGAIVFADGGGSIDYSYDEFGNLETAYDVLNGITRNLYWDNMGRLIAVVDNVGPETTVIAEYVYDALGRRVAKHIGNGIQVQYALFGDDVVEEYHEKAEWVYGRVHQIHHDLTATDRYFRWDEYLMEDVPQLTHSLMPVQDARNNVTMIVNSSGIIEDSLEYGLYGDHAQPQIAPHYPYTFSGRRYDPETGMMYYRSRYYSAQMKRFISLDTIGIWGDMNNYGNAYAYVGGMLNEGLDTSGEQKVGPSSNALRYGPLLYRHADKLLDMKARAISESNLKSRHPGMSDEIRNDILDTLDKINDDSDAAEIACGSTRCIVGANGGFTPSRPADVGTAGDITPEDIHDIKNFIRRQSGRGIQYQYKYMVAKTYFDETPIDWWQWDGIKEAIMHSSSSRISIRVDPIKEFWKAFYRKALLPTIKFTVPPSDDPCPNNPDNFKGQIWGPGALGGNPSMQDELNSLSTLTNGKVGPAVDPPPFSSMHVHYVVYDHLIEP